MLYFFRKFCYLIRMKEVFTVRKQEIFDLLYQLASPVAMILVGLVLLICPDTASVLAARLLGGCITLTGIGFGIGAIMNRRKAVSRGITAVGLACIGGFLTSNPLVLAAFVGRLLGVLIALRGLRELYLAKVQGHGGILAGIITAVGVVLTVLPLTASRLVFSLCGLVLLGAGVLMLADRLRNRQLPRGKNDIIDV